MYQPDACICLLPSLLTGICEHHGQYFVCMHQNDEAQRFSEKNDILGYKCLFLVNVTLFVRGLKSLTF